MTQFFSDKYGDIYFSQANPEAEKQFVFIEANQIGERIVAADEFIVAELGFGFGLNCALTLHTAKQAGSLHKLRYFSVEENFPDEAAVKALGDRLKICREEFTSPQPGPEVYHGDVLKFLEEATFAADVWYFDGFSPAKNPAMWSEAVFARAFALTKPLGTFSTYSAAGWVRRNLQNAGFEVERVTGFSGKREMLVGHKP